MSRKFSLKIIVIFLDLLVSFISNRPFGSIIHDIAIKYEESVRHVQVWFKLDSRLRMRTYGNIVAMLLMSPQGWNRLYNSWIQIFKWFVFHYFFSFMNLKWELYLAKSPFSRITKLSPPKGWELYRLNKTSTSHFTTPQV